MMKFEKYPSIENFYREKYIKEILMHYPEMMDKMYIITEKLHGSNTQLIFNPGAPMQVASRRSLITKGVHSHFNVWEVLEKYDIVLQGIQRLVDQHKNGIVFYSELFGPGINKGINYGLEKQIRFFDARTQLGWLTQKQLIEFCKRLGTSLFVPIIGYTQNLAEALAFETNFNSKIPNPEIEDNLCEGIVIKPFDHICVDWNGDLFYLKKKNEIFAESKPKKKNEIRAETRELNEIFKTYITDVRLQSVFSKEEYITNKSQIGKYVRLLLEDAKEDFLKDYPDVKPEEHRKLFHVGDKAARLIMRYL